MTGVSVTLKIATSLDGRIALADGTSQWITNANARARGHALRASHAGIVVGINTVLADDPLLTARTVPAPSRQPARIVLDSKGRTPVTSRLVASIGLSPVIIATAQAPSQPLRNSGAQVWDCGGADGRVSPVEVVRRAAVEGLSSLMIEGGGQVAASFLRVGLVDRIAWFRAPIILGGDGLAAIGPLALSEIDHAARWRLTATERIGDNTLDSYIKVTSEE